MTRPAASVCGIRRSRSRPPISASASMLGYAGTVHAAQGRTVDTAHALVDAGTTRALAYVALTRGRAANYAYAVTEATATGQGWQRPGADLRPGTRQQRRWPGSRARPPPIRLHRGHPRPTGSACSSPPWNGPRPTSPRWLYSATSRPRRPPGPRRQHLDRPGGRGVRPPLRRHPCPGAHRRAVPAVPSRGRA